MRSQIYRSISIESGCRILLLRWATEERDKFENVVCVDADGREAWRAELPANVAYRDCFVALRNDDTSVLATTFSGYEMKLDKLTGACVGRTRNG